MRFMGWSFRDLLDCPVAYLEVIPELMREEAKREAKKFGLR